MVLAALLAGCGAYTRHQFVARADAICTAATRQARSLTPPVLGTGASATQSVAGYFDKVASIVGTEARSLRRLPRPVQTSRRRSELNAYLAAIQAAAAGFDAAALAAASGNPGRLRGVESALAASPVQARAAAYGLGACAAPEATGGSTTY